MGVSVDYLKSLNDNSAKTDLSWLRSMAGF